MKKQQQPIPLRSIVILPRWMMISGVALAAAIMLAGLYMLVYALGWTSGSEMGGWIGGAIGCLGGGAGALFGTLADWKRRLPATVYLRHLNNDEPAMMYRRVFWPALGVLAIGILLGCLVWNHQAVWQGVVQTSGILVFISGSIEIMRRHSTHQARAVFALYADGALDAEDTEAIDDARQKDEKFDEDVETYLEVSDRVRAFAAGGGFAADGPTTERT